VIKKNACSILSVYRIMKRSVDAQNVMIVVQPVEMARNFVGTIKSARKVS
jgi:hypothetical protein